MILRTHSERPLVWLASLIQAKWLEAVDPLLPLDGTDLSGCSLFLLVVVAELGNLTGWLRSGEARSDWTKLGLPSLQRACPSTATSGQTEETRMGDALSRGLISRLLLGLLDLLSSCSRLEVEHWSLMQTCRWRKSPSLLQVQKDLPIQFPIACVLHMPTLPVCPYVLYTWEVLCMHG